MAKKKEAIVIKSSINGRGDDDIGLTVYLLSRVYLRRRRNLMEITSPAVSSWLVLSELLPAGSDDDVAAGLRLDVIDKETEDIIVDFSML